MVPEEETGAPMALDSGSISFFRHVVEAVPMAWAVETSSDGHKFTTIPPKRSSISTPRAMRVIRGLIAADRRDPCIEFA